MTVADRAGWAYRVRDGVLLVLGTTIILVETIAWVLLGQAPQYLIVGAGLVILGVIPKLPDGK